MFKQILACAWAAGAMLAAPTLAAPITYSFTGEVDYDFQGPQPLTTRQFVRGSFTLDPATFQDGNTEITSSSQKKAGLYQRAQQTNPLQMSGQADTGASQVTVGGGTAYDLAEIAIERSQPGISRVNNVQVRVASYGTDFSISKMTLEIFDALGSSSLIFPEIGGGNDVTQAINWLATEAQINFARSFFSVEKSIQQPTGVELIIYQSGRLTSVVVSTHAVPEPGALGLVGLGFAAMVFARRRQRQAHHSIQRLT